MLSVNIYEEELARIDTGKEPSSVQAVWIKLKLLKQDIFACTNDSLFNQNKPLLVLYLNAENKRK